MTFWSLFCKNSCLLWVKMKLKAVRLNQKVELWLQMNIELKLTKNLHKVEGRIQFHALVLCRFITASHIVKKNKSVYSSHFNAMQKCFVKMTQLKWDPRFLSTAWKKTLHQRLRDKPLCHSRAEILGWTAAVRQVAEWPDEGAHTPHRGCCCLDSQQCRSCTAILGGQQREIDVLIHFYSTVVAAFNISLFNFVSLEQHCRNKVLS